jgi:hypothetical protein
MRTCGSCMLCCKLPVIKSLGKEGNKWCAYAKISRGCIQYEQRPQDCREFSCEWLKDAEWGQEWFPGKAKFYLALKPSGILVVMADPSAPSSWRKPEYIAPLRKKSTELLEEGNYVLVLMGQRAFIILPHKELETKLPPEGYTLTLRPIQKGVEVDFEAVIVANG